MLGSSDTNMHVEVSQNPSFSSKISSNTEKLFGGSCVGKNFSVSIGTKGIWYARVVNINIMEGYTWYSRTRAFVVK